MTAIDDVLELDRQRIRAMLNKDIGALNTILADDLVYTDANAKKDNKDSLINAMLSGAIGYRQIDVRMTDARDFGDSIVLIGEADMTVSVFGQRAAFEVRFTNIYIRREDRWQMAVSQSTKTAG
jgi:ketosteroid isomerase-like protein